MRFRRLVGLVLGWAAFLPTACGAGGWSLGDCRGHARSASSAEVAQLSALLVEVRAGLGRFQERGAGWPSTGRAEELVKGTDRVLDRLGDRWFDEPVLAVSLGLVEEAGSALDRAGFTTFALSRMAGIAAVWDSVAGACPGSGLALWMGLVARVKAKGPGVGRGAARDKRRGGSKAGTGEGDSDEH